MRRGSQPGTVYVLHFDPPYAAPIGSTGRVKTAGHYVGWTAGDPYDRMHEHLRGAGSPLVRAAVRAGCVVTLASHWPGSRTDERRIKRSHHRERACGICTPTARRRPGAGSV